MSPFTHLYHLSVLLLLAALQAEAATHFIGCLSSNAASSISCLLCTWAHSSHVQIEKLLTLAHPSEFVPRAVWLEVNQPLQRQCLSCPAAPFLSLRHLLLTPRFHRHAGPHRLCLVEGVSVSLFPVSWLW